MPHTECVAGDEQKQFTVRDISGTGASGTGSDGAGSERSARHEVLCPHGHHKPFSRYLVLCPRHTLAFPSVSKAKSERERLKRWWRNTATNRAAYYPYRGGRRSEEVIPASGRRLSRAFGTKSWSAKASANALPDVWRTGAGAARAARFRRCAALTEFASTHVPTYESPLELTAEYIPKMTSKLEHYSGHQPIRSL